MKADTSHSQMGQIFWPKLFWQKEPLCLCNTITANTNIVCKTLNKSLDLNCFIKEHIEILFILKISLAFSQIQHRILVFKSRNNVYEKFV